MCWLFIIFIKLFENQILAPQCLQIIDMNATWAGDPSNLLHHNIEMPA